MLHKGQLLLKLPDLRMTPVQDMGPASPTETHRPTPFAGDEQPCRLAAAFPRVLQ